jgi:hypothetical protein
VLDLLLGEASVGNNPEADIGQSMSANAFQLPLQCYCQNPGSPDGIHQFELARLGVKLG